MFCIEKLVDTLKGIIANILDEFFKLLVISGGKFAGVGVDGCDKSSGFGLEKLIELLELLVHFRYCVHHFLYNSN